MDINKEPPEFIWAWFIRLQDGHWIGKTCTSNPNVKTAVRYKRVHEEIRN